MVSLLENPLGYHTRDQYLPSIFPSGGVGVSFVRETSSYGCLPQNGEPNGPFSRECGENDNNKGVT